MFFFSIIVPLFNKELYLRRALESINVQTFGDYEVIIVDDGSTDGSAEVARKYLKSNWQLHQQPNAGVSAARNKGVELSHGQYLCFLDADDAWHPQFLECMKVVIDAKPGAGLYGANYKAIIGDTLPNSKHSDARNTACKSINLFRTWLVRNPLHTDGMIVSREVFDETGGFDISQRYYEDATLMFKIAAKYPVVVTSNVLTYYFTDVADNANSRMKKEPPLFPGYLPTLLELSKSTNDFWLRFFTKMELFLALASNLYFHREERNPEIADRLSLPKDTWLFHR